MSVFDQFGGLGRRVAAAFGANAFGQMVTVFIQLVSVPLFLYFWDAEKYGFWLMITAIPTYFAMADVGFVTVAANKMTMLRAEGKSTESNVVFQSATLITVVMITVFLLVSIVILVFFDFGLTGVRGGKVAVFLLVISTLIGVFCGLFTAIFRAMGRYEIGAYMYNLARLIEFGGYVISLFAGGGYIEVALGGFVGRLLSLIGMYLYTSKKDTGFEWGFSFSSNKEIERLVRPSFAFMMVPIANSISIQGMSFFFGYVFGPVVLIAFNAYRTLSRLIYQAVAMVGNSLWPEISRLYAIGDNLGVIKLLKFGRSLCVCLSLSLSVFLYLNADWILSRWTHGAVLFESTLMVVFLFSTFVTSLWYMRFVFVMATNKHETLSVLFVVFSVLSVMFAYTISNIAGIYSAPASLVFLEIAMFLASLKLVGSLVVPGRSEVV